MTNKEPQVSDGSGSDDESEKESEIEGVPKNMQMMMKDIENEESDPEDMPKQTDKRSRKAKQLLREFAQLSTTHGISHMGEAHTKKVLIFWMIMLVMCAFGFAYLFSDTLQRFLLYETNVEITMESRERFFPAVTICNLCPFKKEPLMQVPTLAALVYAFQFGIADQEEEELKTWPYRPAECLEGIIDCPNNIW